jgi:hypothetical protein
LQLKELLIQNAQQSVVTNCLVKATKTQKQKKNKKQQTKPIKSSLFSNENYKKRIFFLTLEIT